ncbi:hypothetical protein CSB45_07920 [candidate division KSB3 bacterium]|uniref:OmpA-like domain-containing protein n=1 Tax=candidate division KSB3 bacterium TaxID=2044937 RepID=A0A2G6E5T5_9BACT|nr:MAG: hypothetical protein CSB45_07920 [candidate division KSB3 bacterium]PIE28364.1 MAG: hypothetical protein CSA57_14290 [candidate division KSB3 bacterium]
MIIKTHIVKYLIPAVIVLSVCSGCALTVDVESEEAVIDPMLQQKAEKAVESARESFNVITELPVQARYSDDVQKARQELVNSEKFLIQNLLDEAYVSAENSRNISQRIVQNFYQHVLAQTAQQTKADIQRISDADPDNPLQDFLPRLDEILDYSDSISQGEELLKFDKMLDDLDRLTQIEHNTRENVARTIGIDVSFKSGSYELTEEGKQLLDDYVVEIMASRDRFKRLYPEFPVTITIKVVGYADQAGFIPGTKLVDQLLEQSEDVPDAEPDRRKFLNQELSELRAKMISEYAVQIIEQYASEQSIVSITQDIKGFGESIPPAVPEPYPIDDARRRICKIYSYITTP